MSGADAKADGLDIECELVPKLPTAKRGPWSLKIEGVDLPEDPASREPLFRVRLRRTDRKPSDAGLLEVEAHELEALCRSLRIPAPNWQWFVTAPIGAALAKRGRA